jgi:hypothetical protein
MTGAAQAQIEWRVSVKFICDANGKRPSGAWIGNHLYAPLTNASQVSNYIAAANLIMDRSGRGYRFRLEEISDVQGAAEYYTADSRDEASRWQVELAARNNPQQYFWRDDALNIYINNSPQGAICGFPVDPLPSGAQLWNIILAGQGGGGATYTNTFAHESGHYFGLCHTMGCLCAACNEGVGCDHNPQDDGIADTLLDTECWTMDDLAKANFNVSHYSLLDSDQQRQVNNTYSNLMSYHDFAYILTSDQLDRMTDTSNGARNNACNRQTVFVDKDNTALSVDGLPNDYKWWAEKNPPPGLRWGSSSSLPWTIAPPCPAAPPGWPPVGWSSAWPPDFNLPRPPTPPYPADWSWPPKPPAPTLFPFGGPRKTFHEGLDQANPGDIVLVRPGNYDEPQRITKAVTIRATRGNVSLGRN